MSGFHIYKRTQGKYTRATTAIVMAILAAWGCYALAGKLTNYNAYVRFGVPLALLGLLCWIIFWITNRPRSADFMIATEGEMKKVSWSSRKEVIGATKVVIVTTFILAAMLFLVDFVFSLIFRVTGVMG